MNKRAEEIRERLAELSEKESEIMTLPTPSAASLWPRILREMALLSEELEKIEHMTEEEYSVYAEEKRREEEAHRIEEEKRRIEEEAFWFTEEEEEEEEPFCIMVDAKDYPERVSSFAGLYSSGVESYHFTWEAKARR